MGDTIRSAPPAPAPPGPRNRPRRDWYDFIQMGFRFFARSWHGCRSNGPAPLPTSGPAVIILNHTSAADMLFITVGCRRPLHYLLTREAYESRLLGWLYRRGCIPVSRDGRDITGVRRALGLLRRGEVLCIAPEGRFSPEEGDLCIFNDGAAFLALHARAPVIPAWITCRRETESALRAGFWPSGRVRVTYGRPVDLSPYWRGPINREVVREVTALLTRRLEELRGEQG